METELKQEVKVKEEVKEPNCAVAEKKKEKTLPTFEDHLHRVFPNAKISEFYELLSPPQAELAYRVKSFSRKDQTKKERPKKVKEEENEPVGEKKEKKKERKRSPGMSLSVGKATCDHFRDVVLTGSLNNLLLEVIKEAATQGTGQIDKYVVANAIRRSLSQVMITNNGEHAFATCVV